MIGGVTQHRDSCDNTDKCLCTAVNNICHEKERKGTKGHNTERATIKARRALAVAART